MNRKDPDSSPSTPDSRNRLRADLQVQVDSAIEYRLFSPIDFELLADGPATILVTPREGGDDRERLGSAVEFIVEKQLPSHSGQQGVLYRGAKLTRLDQIIACGCDVTPTTAPLYAADSAGKALDYGEVVMVFDAAKLEKTFKTVLRSERPEVLRRLRSEYPVEKVIDEKWLQLSRLPAPNRMPRSDSYSRFDFFIPGNPREALLMIFLVGDDRNALRAEFLRCTEKTNRV